MGSIAGIDYDSNAIFVALIDEDSGAWLGQMQADLACGPGDALTRARRARDLLPDRGSWRDHGVTAIGLEATFSRDFKATAALARVQGTIIACLPRDVFVRMLTANGRRTPGWKLLTVGTTNASKSEVKEWATSHGAPAGLPQDLYDAFAIARATRQLQRREDPA